MFIFRSPEASNNVILNAKWATLGFKSKHTMTLDSQGRSQLSFSRSGQDVLAFRSSSPAVLSGQWGTGQTGFAGISGTPGEVVEVFIFSGTPPTKPSAGLVLRAETGEITFTSAIKYPMVKHYMHNTDPYAAFLKKEKPAGSKYAAIVTSRGHAKKTGGMDLTSPTGFIDYSLQGYETGFVDKNDSWELLSVRSADWGGSVYVDGDLRDVRVIDYDLDLAWIISRSLGPLAGQITLWQLRNQFGLVYNNFEVVIPETRAVVIDVTNLS